MYHLVFVPKSMRERDGSISEKEVTIVLFLIMIFI
ncbi:Protein CBG27404 [Caenorhabditis briggsae]|uniref:Protein CBG27404 n=1 Tax=Caenorhabditis briggsae TaxID=6238 RepID=B6IJY1_CAEBR|nr:Protein CBG27404 [Caenorhabditis briggsae]CAS00211.1 Protein CBG27404 [Caenorhabditis briggsae]